MFRPLFFVFALALPAAAAGRDLWIGELSWADFSLELQPIKERTVKDAALAESGKKAATEQLAKFRQLKRKGFASALEVKEQERSLAAANARLAILQSYARTLRLAEKVANGAVSRSIRSATHEAPFQAPGVTQTFGNIDLFTLICEPDVQQLQAAIELLQARQVPTGLGRRLAEVDGEFLSGLRGAIDKLDKPYASDVGRFRARTFVTASNLLTSVHVSGRMERDAARLQALIDLRERGQNAPFPWLSQPLGLLGSGWRIAAAPSPRVVALCLPLARAQLEESGQVRIAEAWLALAEHRLGVKNLARKRDVGTNLEVEGSETELTAARARIEGGAAVTKIRQSRYDLLCELAGGPIGESEDEFPESLPEIEEMALASLETLADQPEFIFGGLLNLETWLMAWLNHENARRELDFHLSHRRQIHALRRSTANERRRVSLQADLAEATHLAAAESLRQRALEFQQWVAAADLARNPQTFAGSRLPASALSRSAEIARANEEFLRALHDHHAAYFHFQDRYVAKLERVHRRGAASSYELAQTRSRLTMMQGNVEKLQPALDLLGLERELHDALSATSPANRLRDLSPAANRLLAEISSVRERPNPGALKNLDAAHAFIRRRAEKMRPLVAKGFATKLELAEIERSRETYRLIADAERQRGLATAPAAAVVGKPAPQPPRTLELPGLTLTGPETGSRSGSISASPAPFPEVATKEQIPPPEPE